MSQKIFSGDVDKLRSQERRNRLQVERVVGDCLSGQDFKSMLDVGTGTGLFAESFANAGLRVKGIDLNPEFIKIASSHVPSAEFRVGKAEKLPFDSGSYDLVFLGHVLHESEDPARALEEAARVAKKRVAVLEWPYLDQEIGPPLDHRIATEDVLRYSQEIGFSIADVIFMRVMQLYILEK